MSTKQDELFNPGDKVRWNYRTDLRTSGWFYGEVIEGPVRIGGGLAYKIKSHESGIGWRPAGLIERDPT